MKNNNIKFQLKYFKYFYAYYVFWFILFIIFLFLLCLSCFMFFFFYFLFLKNFQKEKDLTFILPFLFPLFSLVAFALVKINFVFTIIDCYWIDTKKPIIKRKHLNMYIELKNKIKKECIEYKVDIENHCLLNKIDKIIINYLNFLK